MLVREKLCINFYERVSDVRALAQLLYLPRKRRMRERQYSQDYVRHLIELYFSKFEIGFTLSTVFPAIS